MSVGIKFAGSSVVHPCIVIGNRADRVIVKFQGRIYSVNRSSLVAIA